MSRSSRTSEEEIINNHKLNMLYSHDFENGRFFQVVHQDEQGFEVKLASKTMLKAVYMTAKDDIEGIEIIKIVNNKETQKVRLSKFNFAQLKAFLTFISQIDLKGITEKRLKLYDGQSLDNDTIKIIRTLLSKEGGADIIEAIINEGILTSKDIVNTGFRKKGLQIFELFINKEDYWKHYAEKNNLSANSEEKAIQYFLEKNEWIFGYGLDYRYQKILQREVHLSNSTLNGSNEIVGDYLLGDKRFTTFVELKKPTTPIFGRNINRSNSWSLSRDLVDSVSQILSQKAAGMIKLNNTQFDSSRNRIQQKAFDSKVILVIGNWNEIENSKSDLEKEIKKETFELFRRDSRNIEIITYDELFERAKFIVE